MTPPPLSRSDPPIDPKSQEHHRQTGGEVYGRPSTPVSANTLRIRQTRGGSRLSVLLSRKEEE